MKPGKFSLPTNRTLIMGVLNVTPDSFSDGGKFIDVDKAVAHAKQMAEDGADIIDVGGESSRPGSDPVSEDEEMKRVVPVIEKLSDKINVPISIDTYKAAVAEKSLGVGASLVNDISGLGDDVMIKVVAKYGCPVVIMHMQGKPKSMQTEPVYTDVVNEIKDFFVQQISVARTAGIKEIIIDPGIGFGKTVSHNLQILNRLDEFTKLDAPVLVGASNKNFIGEISGAEIDDRLAGTLAAHSIAILNGANMIRVHDVAKARQAARVADAIKLKVWTE